MLVRTIEAKNFRGLPEFSLHFSNLCTVILGNNGVGKSSILDLMAMMLSQIRILSNEQMNAKGSDIRNGQDSLHARICCEHDSSFIMAEYEYKTDSLSSRYYENQSGRFGERGASPLYEHFNNLKNQELPFSSGYPLVVYYPTNRAILDIPERIRGFKPAVHPLDAMDNALSNILDFKTFIALFRQSESAVKSASKDSYVLWQEKQIAAVNEAITSIVPEFGELHVTQRPFRIGISKHDEFIDFLQLSDGEKCLVALVGDLAQRMAIANPTLDNPLHGSAVVLIDEIELHLHPRWQRSIICRLQKTFPNCQFIMTTHSPMVITEPETLGVFAIDDNGKFIEHSGIYGLAIEQTLTEIMGAKVSPDTVRNELDAVMNALAEKDMATARQLLSILKEKLSPNHHELVRAEIILRKMECLNALHSNKRQLS